MFYNILFYLIFFGKFILLQLNYFDFIKQSDFGRSPKGMVDI